MDVLRGTSPLARPLRQPVIAIGNFDGVHVGHQRLFQLAREQARAGGGESAVLTFDPHPVKLLAPSLAPPLITTPAHKLELIAATGDIDACVVEPFTRALAELPPEDFVDEILRRRLGASALVIGHDFTFGKARRGDTAFLKAHAGIPVLVVPPVTAHGLVASSTKVREFVLEGRMDGARLLLGRPFSVSGEVGRGAGRGKSLGIPTANLKTREELMPKGGVYAGHAIVGAERVLAAVNVGTNPTFVAAGETTIEAHLLDFDQDLYGQVITLELDERLRGEERFPGPDALLAQIHKDIARVRERKETE